jgi:hypothetical protein
MWTVLVALIGASLTAYLAARKGRRPALWFLFGLALLIVALPAVLFVEPSSDTHQRCANCWKWSHRRKRICRKCGDDLPTRTAP